MGCLFLPLFPANPKNPRSEEPTVELERMSTNYAVSIATDQMLALMNAEGLYGPLQMEPHLSERLEKISGVSKVDYDGHFGAAVYLTVDFDSDTTKTHDAIASVIAEHLARCKTAREAELENLAN
jgi:hypothetical protein